MPFRSKKPAQKPLTVKFRPSFEDNAPAIQKTRPLMKRLKQPKEQAMGTLAMSLRKEPTVVFRAARRRATISRSRNEPCPRPGTKEQATSRPIAEKTKRRSMLMKFPRPSRGHPVLLIGLSDDAARRHTAGEPHVAADGRALSQRDAAEDGGIGVNDDVIFHHRSE